MREERCSSKSKEPEEQVTQYAHELEVVAAHEQCDK
jgi:hypothetical protein